MSVAALTTSVQEPLFLQSGNLTVTKTKYDHSESKRLSSGSWKEHVPVFLRPRDRPDPRFPRRAGLLMEDFGDGGESSAQSHDLAPGSGKGSTRPVLHKAHSLPKTTTREREQPPPLPPRRVRFSEDIQKHSARLRSGISSEDFAGTVPKGRPETTSSQKQDKSFKPRLEKLPPKEKHLRVPEARPRSPKVKRNNSTEDHPDVLPKQEGSLRERLDYHVRQLDTLQDMTKHFNHIKNLADMEQGEMEAMKDETLTHGRGKYRLPCLDFTLLTCLGQSTRCANRSVSPLV